MARRAARQNRTRRMWISPARRIYDDENGVRPLFRSTRFSAIKINVMRLPALLGLALFAVPSTTATPEKLAAPIAFENAFGTRVTLDHPGMLYLVDFWAEGCKPCMEEMPELTRLATKYERTGRFKLISVLWGGWKGDQLKSFAKRYEVEQGFYGDPDDWLEKLGEKAFPTKYLIRDGEILYRMKGGGPGTYAKWSKVIEAELHDR